MAKTTVKRTYFGRADKPVGWEAILRIFDAIWKDEKARELPTYPNVIGGVNGSWKDALGTEHKASSVDEIKNAYIKKETAVISFNGSLGSNSYQCNFIR